MTTLQALRIYGPLDCFEIQAKTKAPLNDVADDICRLHDEGLACNPTGYLWDVTEAGRHVFKQSLKPKPSRAARRWRLRRAS